MTYETNSSGAEVASASFHELALTKLTELAELVPELATERERIARGVAELTEDLDIQPAFWDDPNRSLLLFSTALIAEQTDGDGVLTQNRRFAYNVAARLTRRFVSREGSVDELEDELTQAGLQQRLAAYEQPQVALQLQEYVDRHSIFDAVRERTAPLVEREPTIHVLDVDTYHKLFFESSEERPGLAERTAAFLDEIPDGAAYLNANAFILGHDIYVPITSAQLLLADEEDVDIKPNASKEPEVVARTLAHEYVHTKGSLIVEDAFGHALEERRAELLSGDHRAYYDVKHFFNALAIVSDHRIGDILDQAIQSNEQNVYAQVANAYGLARLAQIATVQPGDYNAHHRTDIEGAVAADLGGFDGVITHYVDSLDQDAKEQARARLLERIIKVRDQNGVVTPEIRESLRHNYGTLINALDVDLATILS